MATVRNILFIGSEKCLKELKATVGVASKRRFWSGDIFPSTVDQNQLFRTKIAFWHVIIMFEG